jgi:hypothetical protein
VLVGCSNPGKPLTYLHRGAHAMTVWGFLVQDPSLFMTAAGLGVMCLLSAIGVAILWRSFRIGAKNQQR